MSIFSNKTILGLIASILVPVSGVEAQQPSSQAAGIWEAERPFGPATLRLRLEIEPSARGLRGQITSISEKEDTFPVDRLEVDGSSILLQSCALDFNPFQVVMGATYEGTLSEDGSAIRGTLSQMGLSFPVEFRRAAPPESAEAAQNASLQPPAGPAGGVPPCPHPARDAAERILDELPGVIERGDREELRTFVSESFPSEALGPVGSSQGTLLEIWVDRFSTFHHASHGYELQEVQDAGTNWATALYRNRLTGDATTLTVMTDAESPHHIVSLRFTPVAAPAPASGPEAMSTRQVARELEGYVERLADADVFSGAVLLAKDGKVVFEAAYGMASKNFSVPNTIDSRFSLSSMPKMFTAIAIMQLVERGKLSLDDPLSKFLPDFPDQASAGKIRIEHLLTHTAGLGDFRSESAPEAYRNTYRSVDDMMERAASEELLFEPGTRFQYSNTGFLVLGKVIEVVTGVDYFEYIREHVYEPAGMTESGTFPPGRPDRNLAISYDRQYTDDGFVYAAEHDPGYRVGGPAGGGASTVHDLLKFADALLAHKLVSAETLDVMFSTNPALNARYGYGFQVSPEFSRVGHSGGSRGRFSNLDMFLESGWTAIVLSNYSEGNVPAYPSVIGKIRELVGACDEQSAGFRLCVQSGTAGL